MNALESCHAEVGRVADKTGCKSIDADASGDSTKRRMPLRPHNARGQEGPARQRETHSSTSMAFSVACRLVAPTALSEQEGMRIDMRASSALHLRPRPVVGARQHAEMHQS
eukprot:2734612-Pleurochrysis_carterae.AAC.3